MKTSLIIGSGQIGSRHLQGLLKLGEPQTIYVLDPSQDSLNVANKRANEIAHTHKVLYTREWTGLPAFFDLVIVATKADSREKVVTQLLQSHNVSYLILEKVLFQELDAYRRVNDLLATHQVKTWVNHPRRIYESYEELKKMMNLNESKVFQITGGNWGLGSNGLHFIDLIVFLSGHKLTSLNADWVNHTLLESKRPGFVEFTGTIKGRMKDGSVLEITSLKGEPSAISVAIFDNSNRFVIQEAGAPQLYHLSKKNDFKLETAPFTIEFQSNLTTRMAKELFAYGKCGLPTYAEACHSHELFIFTLLKKYCQINNAQTTILPIT